MTWRRLYALVLGSCLVALALPARGGAETDALEARGSLDAGFSQVLDVRWGDGGDILMAAFRKGTVAFRISEGGEPDFVRTVLPAGIGGSPGFQVHLGYSAGVLAVGSTVFEVATVDLKNEKPQVRPGPPFEFIHDLDLHGDKLVVLGSRRDDRGVPEPVIAWLIDLGSGAETPLVRSIQSPTGPWPIDSCGSFQLGAVKFLPSGELVVVPGVEPDIYLFQPDGRLVRTWPTDVLGLVDDCSLKRDEIEHLGRNEEDRWRWMNRHRSVDDIVPLPGDEIGLLVRDPVAGDGVRWELVRLGRDGRTAVAPLPLRSESDRSFLRADVTHGEAVVLIAQWWSKDTAVDTPPQLWTGRFTPRP